MPECLSPLVPSFSLGLSSRERTNSCLDFFNIVIFPLSLLLFPPAKHTVDGYWSGVMGGQGWAFDDVRGLE